MPSDITFISRPSAKTPDLTASRYVRYPSRGGGLVWPPDGPSNRPKYGGLMTYSWIASDRSHRLSVVFDRVADEAVRTGGMIPEHVPFTVSRQRERRTEFVLGFVADRVILLLDRLRIDELEQAMLKHISGGERKRESRSWTTP